MALIQNIIIRASLILFLFLPTLLFAQGIQPRQMEATPGPGYFMISVFDSLGVADYRYGHQSTSETFIVVGDSLCVASGSDTICYAELGVGSGTLNDLTDVTITAAGSNDFLQYVGGTWADRTPTQVASTLALQEMGDISGGFSGDDVLVYTGFSFLPTPRSVLMSLNTISNVSLSSPTNDDILTYKDGTWINVIHHPVIHLPKDVQQDVGGANGTVTYISWDATAVKKDAGYVHEDVTNPTRIEVDSAGRYRLDFVVSATQSGADRTTLMTHYRIDGTTVVTRGRQRNYTRGSIYGDVSVGMNTEIDLTAGQYIEVGITVDDTDATYTLNTINAECELILRRM